MVLPTASNRGADPAQLGGFYAEVAGLGVMHEEQDYIVLESEAFQFVVVAVPRGIAASIHVTHPPRRRENTAVKLALPVASLAAARQAAQSLGGQLCPPEREWLFQGSRVCDGLDPEGNVVQFREHMLFKNGDHAKTVPNRSSCDPEAHGDLRPL